jgi:chaperonin GroEL
MSNSTRVIFAAEARKQLFDGMKIAAEAVGCTLGPKGRTVLIQHAGSAPIVTKDGVSVSKSINLKDPVMRMGAELIREAASRTNEVAGDGTTTATVLTHALVRDGLMLVAAGYSPTQLCKGIERAAEGIIAELKSSAKLLTTSKEVAQVGTISANGDTNIGKLIAEAMEKVGRDGIITVEDAKGMSTSLDVVEGMQFDRGYLSPYFVTNPERMQTTYVDPYVLVTDKKISRLQDIVPILEQVMRQQRSLLIIAEDVDGDALQGLVVNRVKSNLSVIAIKAPGYGKHRDELLNDICVLTGAKLISASTNLTLEKLSTDDLGQCKKIVVDAKSSTLVGAGKTKNNIDDHVSQLRSQLEDVTLSIDEITKLKVRIAKLASGVAIVRVGGATEVEMVERKYRIEDALNATRAAAEEGIVMGGGMALMYASNKLNISDDDIGVQSGIDIVKGACIEPFRRILKNAGKSPDVVIERLQTQNTVLNWPGYNAATGKIVDMMDAGIIDPIKVTRVALQHAVSVAVTFLSLDAVVYDEEDVVQTNEE